MNHFVNVLIFLLLLLLLLLEVVTFASFSLVNVTLNSYSFCFPKRRYEAYNHEDLHDAVAHKFNKTRIVSLREEARTNQQPDSQI